jgi:N-acetylneuraminate synthase
MVKRLELNEAAHRMLIEHCKEKGIEFLSTPFDLESLDMLVNQFRLPNIKLPSGEITNGPLLLEAARSGTNIILSTGMCNLGDIETALGILAFGYMDVKERPSLSLFEQAYNSVEGRSLLKKRVTLLHCTTEYPAPLEDVNLRVMDTLKASFELPVGYSDHTMGVTIPIAAVARGACVIEKHFTLDRQLPGPDHKASLEPDELIQMARAIRDVEKALGSTIKSVTPSEMPNRKIARKSIVATKPIKKGEMFTGHNLGIKRPGTGLSPLKYWDLLGGVAERDYAEDEEIGP